MSRSAALLLLVLSAAAAGAARAQSGGSHPGENASLRLSQSTHSSPVRFSGRVTQRAPVQIARRPFDADLTWRWPAAPWDLQDSAYYDYKRALSLMDDGDFRMAALFFEKIHRNYPRSVYAAESFYWHAFSLYRVGTERNLRKAIELLETQRWLHPRSRTASDALTLATRMRGDLALAGSENALRELGQALRNADECSGTGVNVKIAALNAFQQIDAAMTVNYLRDVFQRRNPCARYLREQSVFILAQIHTPEADELMLGLARDAGDLNVRIEAVQFLAEVPDVRAVALLESIVRGSAPTRLRESALFALARQSTMVDASLFRDIAESPYTPPQLRVQAVQWLAEQQFLDESSLFLRLYKVERNDDVRHALVNAVASQKNVSDAPWLLQVGRDSSTALATRKLAISAAAALQAPPSELYKLYREVELVPLRQQIIDILGRHREQVAVSMLIDIVSVEAVTTLRGTSLSWLRQSKDPRAVAFISSYREK